MKLPFIKISVYFIKGTEESVVYDDTGVEIKELLEYLIIHDVFPENFKNLNKIEIEVVRELNENTLYGNVRVLYKGVEYRTGNRRGYLVELYTNDDTNKFVKTVSMKEIEVLD